MLKKIAVIAGAILIVFLIFKVFSLYHYRFSDRFSNDPSIWGQYGDYIGGLLNPLFSLINIVVLIYLTFIVSKNDDNRSKNELRYRALKEFTDKFFNLDVLNTANKGGEVRHVDKPFALITYLKKFRSYHNYFFLNELQKKKFDLVSQELIEGLTTLVAIRNQDYKIIDDDPRKFDTPLDVEVLERVMKKWRQNEHIIKPLESKLITLMLEIYENRD